MNDKKLRELIRRLNSHLISSTNQISPTLGSGCSKIRPFPLFISNDMLIEQLSDNELLLAHVLIHKFYANRANKDFTKEDLQELHERVKRLLPNHTNF